MNYYIIHTEVEGSKRHCLSLLPGNAVTPAKDKHTIIAGFLPDEQADPGRFTEYTPFKQWLHQLIALHLPEQATFLEEGKKTGNGYVYAIDKRTKKPKGDIPIQDIIGAINFENGNAVRDSYLPNLNYKLFTKDGLFQLPFALEAILIQHIKAGH